ncbi:hypothetical protein CYMTET_33099, partial [Cymbomonas tetramitiformis]
MRLMAGKKGLQQGAFNGLEEVGGAGKVKYAHCRTSVVPPSNFDGVAAQRSAELPDAELNLEFVYGHGMCASSAPAASALHVLMNEASELVYIAAALAVVYNPWRHEQRFFRGHDDDVKCLAVEKEQGLVATGQAGRKPMVCVWWASSCKERTRFRLTE